MNTLNDSLESCTALPRLGRLGMQMLYGAGDSPGWSLVRYKLQTPIEKLSECTESRGTFTARIAVRDAQVWNVAVGTRQRDATECITDALRKLETKQLGGGTYELIVRAQPPQGKAMTAPTFGTSPSTPAPSPSARTADTVPETLSTLVLSADFQQLQTDLRHAKVLCTPEPEPSCAQALRALRPHFAALTPGDKFGAAPLRHYELNKLGADFDCVRVERDRPFQRNTALAMLRPSQLRAGRWLMVPSPQERLTNLEQPELSDALHGELVHFHNLRGSDLSLCFTFDGGGSSQWRLGMATYYAPPSGEPYDWHRTDIQAFGLSQGKPDYQKMRDAIVAKRFGDVRALLAAGTKLDGIKGPLALAVHSQWPREQLEILLRAKANPNELDENESTSMHEAAMTILDEDEAVATLRLLKQHGGDVNLMLLSGGPLHWIAQYKKRDKIWQALINMGADPHLPNSFGTTAMELHCLCRQ